MASRRRRRLDGWGFEDRAFEPPERMLEWLGERLGSAVRVPRTGVETAVAGLDEAAPLPYIAEVPTRDGSLERLSHARGQGLPDVLRLRIGKVDRVPDVVCYPTTADQIATLLATAEQHQLRIVPWGGGTSVTGGVNTPRGAAPVVVVDLAGLSGLHDLDAESGLATLGAGTVGPDIEAALGAHGFTLGHFPQSFELSTLGGWIVTQSSGQESIGVGRIEARVAGLEAVAPAGRLSVPALPASAAGPDLRQWLTGSEGRLGIVTQASMRVRKVVGKLAVEAALMPDWLAGIDCARTLVQQRVPLSLMRLSDEAETEMALAVGLAHSPLAPIMRAYLRLRGVAGGCLMLFGARGDNDSRSSAIERARGLIKRAGGVPLGAGPGRNWQRDRFRHPYLRDGLLDHGYAVETLETAAPWSRHHQVYDAVRRAIASVELAGEQPTPVLCHLSHAYPDGASLYFTFFFRCPHDVDQAIDRWARLKRAASDAIAATGAATSHHHGVGIWHAPWLGAEIGAGGRRLLAAVARELDPQGILNPHVLLADSASSDDADDDLAELA